MLQARQKYVFFLLRQRVLLPRVPAMPTGPAWSCDYLRSFLRRLWAPAYGVFADVQECSRHCLGVRGVRTYNKANSIGAETALAAFGSSLYF
ncbi:MAG: hypothetical protein M3N14_07175 [Bacteroidota bacterium]|nr:hypothetical protein [Bacteroidota bacterium]